MAISIGFRTLDCKWEGRGHLVLSGLKSFLLNPIIYASVFFLLVPSSVSSQEYPDSINTARFIEIQKFLFDDRFVKAR